MTRSWLIAASGAALACALLVAAPGPTVRGQDACVAEREPNDTEVDLGAVTSTQGAMCVSGALPQGDQDLSLWEVTEQDARSSWTLAVDGVPDVVTTLKVFAITSDPGIVPVEAGGVVTDLDVRPFEATPAKSEGLLFQPGRYLIGIARSDPPDGSQPDPPAYRFSLEPGALPEAPEDEPNDSADQATPLTGVFDIGGDLGGSIDYYTWTVPPADADLAWEFHGRGVLGTLLSLHVTGPDGEPFLDTDSDFQGRLDLVDLHLPPGEYRFYVSGGRDAPSPYRITTSSGPPVGDPEPNDLIDHAAPIATDAHLVTGRLAADGDRDHYRLTFPDDAPPVLRDIRLISGPGLQRELCLMTPDGQTLQCRAGTDGVALRNVLLGPGDHILRIGGDASMDEGYTLRIDESVAPPPDFEAEPNDLMDLATPFDSSLVMHGRGGPDDTDLYRMHVDGAAGLWDVAVSGERITALDWYRADHSRLASAEVSPDGTSAVLRDLYLVPGDQMFAVDAASGDYQLRATYTGPLDPSAEREPNDDELEANPYRIDTTRSGRLTTDSEVDVFRFSLSSTEHLRIDVQPPADGSVTLELDRDGRRIAGRDPPGTGEPTTYEAGLAAGDYEIILRAGTPSDGHYALSVDRLDPFDARDDLEPNDDEWATRPMPASGFVRGAGALPSDQDWYLLPASADGAPISVVLEGEDARPMLSDGTSRIPMTLAEDGRTWTSDPVPQGVVLFLGVELGGDGTYTLALAGGAEPPPVGDATFSVTLDTADPTVAAYWPEAQRVAATLHVHPVGPVAGGPVAGGPAASGSVASGPLELAIDARTSNDEWLVDLGPATVTVDGGDAELPIVVHVPADAWADDPVRVTVRARSPDGRSATASVDITPDRAAPPVAPEQAWSVPAALLGGVDVAATALGAMLVDPLDPDLEAQLHDGTAHSGLGWYLPRDSWTLPVTLTVDLAGDAPIPIAGTIIDPQSQEGSTDQVPRRFELLLSMDGTAWTSVLEGELSPRMTDQAFVLDAPVEARFAQLRLLSSWAPRGSELALGEWKVVAVPGTPTEPATLDIADAALGGHVSWMDPQTGEELFWRGMLDEDPQLQQMQLDAGSHLTWAVGFRDDRAALISELQWVDPADTDPKLRFRKVDVAVSVQGPAGPWQELGTWKLDRAADGSVAPFTLPEPTWARFVRFTGDAPRKDTYYWAMPATLRVIEAPTGPDYRSVVGEWGALRPVGPFEYLHPPPVISLPPDEAGTDDTRETATLLTPDETVAGRVARGSDVDWYTVVVPEGQNTLSIDLRGAPILAAAATVFDADGLEVPLVVAPGDDGASQVAAATVDPGTYWVRIDQPVSSVVIAFDTSASMADYFPYVFEGMRSFTADVAEGEESVLVVPFEERSLLPDWSDQAYELEDAVNQFVLDGLSSGLEAAVIDASRELSARRGARAVLVLTDAETSTYRLSAEMWRSVAAVRPLVFSAQVGAQGQPLLSEQYLQDLAAVAGGFHQYARSHAELDRAFDRLATWLRRPAAYELRATISFREPPPESRTPGSIRVVTPPGEAGASATTIGTDVGVEIILDTSGSMLKKIGGVRRIDAAKRVLTDLVTARLPAGTPVAVRVLGSRDDVCGTRLVTPLGPLDPAVVIANVDTIAVDQEADTPLGAALRAVPRDLAGSTGTRIVLLITDSEEVWPHPDLCGDDPAAAIRELRQRGIDARLNIVGLRVEARKAKAQLRRWAKIGNGSFFEARDAEQLGRSIRAAVSAPFRILDANGNEVASGTVGGDPVSVPPGTYSVVVLRDPVARFDRVVVKPKGKVTLTLEPPEDRVPSEGTVPEASPTPASP